MNFDALLLVMNYFPQTAQLIALGQLKGLRQERLKIVCVVLRVTYFLFLPLHHSTGHLFNKEPDFISCHLIHLLKTDMSEQIKPTPN